MDTQPTQFQNNLNPVETQPMPPKSRSTKKLITIVVIVLLILASGAGAYWYFTRPDQVACTQEAKLCADGSYVGRSGPNCEFAACPQAKDETASWQTYRNEEYGFEVKYPPSANIFEVPAGFNNIISAIDFNNVNNSGMVIRVSFFKNSRNDQSLQQLLQVRNGVGMPVPGKYEDFNKIKIGEIDALKKINTIPGNEKIGASVIILGNEYYYIIETGNQYTPGFDSAKEQLFDNFVSTFKFIK